MSHVTSDTTVKPADTTERKRWIRRRNRVSGRHRRAPLELDVLQCTCITQLQRLLIGQVTARHWRRLLPDPFCKGLCRSRSNARFTWSLVIHSDWIIAANCCCRDIWDEYPFAECAQVLSRHGTEWKVSYSSHVQTRYHYVTKIYDTQFALENWVFNLAHKLQSTEMFQMEIKCEKLK